MASTPALKRRFVSFRASNDHNDDKLRPGIPDVNFRINEDDEMVKDQGDGFTWWWARHQFMEIGYSGIVDLFPFTVTIPGAVLEQGLKPHLSISGNTLFVYPSVNPFDNRRLFLQNVEKANDQRSLWNRGVSIMSSPVEIAIPEGDKDIEFLAKAAGQGEKQLTLTLWLKDNGGNFIPADSWRLTVKETKEFWALYSARDKASDTVGYRAEDGRIVSAEHYSPINLLEGARDPNKSKYLLMVHGFNNTVDDARTRYNEIWRRLYWLGFRGQFVGITWHGDVGIWDTGFLSGATFDSSTRNAFKTSTGVMAFLHGNVRNWAGGSHNVDVIAHSLGNLVVWDAMRQYQTTGYAGNTLARNVISVEAAVWPETFEPEDALVYVNETNNNHNTDYSIAYSMDALKEHSWHSWFNQPAHRARDSVGGQVFHSYVDDDKALVHWMRYNDMVKRGTGFTGLEIKKWHFHRHKLQGDPAEWRSPEGKKQSNDGWGEGQGGKDVVNTFHDRIPTLIRHGHRSLYYTFEDLNFPVGAMKHPLAPENSEDAKTLGWREKRHSDFAVGEKGDADSEMWFPVIWEWYNQVVEPALPMGEE